MNQLIYRVIWDLSEFTGIGLGMFAPYVFHQAFCPNSPSKLISNDGVRIE